MIPVMGESEDKDMMKWALDMKKQGLPMGRETTIQKAYEIHHYIFDSMRSVGLVGWGWCDQFISRHGKLTLRTAHVIKWARNKASLEGLWSFFFEIYQHIIERTRKK